MRPVGTARSMEVLRAAPLLVDVKGLRLAFRAYTFPPTCSSTRWAAGSSPTTFPCSCFTSRTGATRTGCRAGPSSGTTSRRRGAQVRISLVALVHWGKEYYARPTADQRDAAHDLVDAGFDLVVGTHSHVLNGAEVYRGKLIAYSMGNFLSQGRILETRLARCSMSACTGLAARSGLHRRLRRPADFLRLPDHVVVPLDSAAGPAVEAAAWAYARLVLGSSVAR